MQSTSEQPEMTSTAVVLIRKPILPKRSVTWGRRSALRGRRLPQSHPKRLSSHYRWPRSTPPLPPMWTSWKRPYGWHNFTTGTSEQTTQVWSNGTKRSFGTNTKSMTRLPAKPSPSSDRRLLSTSRWVSILWPSRRKYKEPCLASSKLRQTPTTSFAKLGQPTPPGLRPSWKKSTRSARDGRRLPISKGSRSMQRTKDYRPRRLA